MRKIYQVKQQETKQQGIQQGIRQGVQQGVQQGLILSGKIFQAVQKNPDFTNERIALEVGCNIEEVESTRKMFGI